MRIIFVASLCMAFCMMCEAVSCAEKSPDPDDGSDSFLKDLDDHAAIKACDLACQRWDVRMRNCRISLARALPDDVRKSFVASQDSWEAYRKDQISFLNAVYEHISGSMYGPMHAYAVMDITRKRALVLERLFEAWKSDGDDR